MKKNDKYFWKIGHPPPMLEQHSAVKHRIIEGYVRDYIRTVMSQVTIPQVQLTLVDGFCGGGAYLAEDGGPVDGSPLLMMRAVREARALLNLGRDKPRKVSVDFEFVDVLPDTTEYLQYWINARTDERLVDAEDHARIAVQCANFLDALPQILARIRQRRLGERAIFVLDQYNYNDLPMPQIAQILRDVSKGEVILTFNVGSLMTYIADHAASRKPLERIGLEGYIPWEHIRTIKAHDSQRWRQVLQRHVAHGIRSETGARFATLFFVKPLGSNSWDYWLIHLSNHYKAHEVMKDLHWAHATEFGHELEPGVFIQGYDANNDVEYTNQNAFDFGDDSRERCIDGIREHFGQRITALTQPVPLKTLVSECAAQSPGSTRHFLEATRQLHLSQDIVVCSADGRIRRPSVHYSLNDIVEPSRHIRLFA